VSEDAENISAWVNWGRLLHELGRTADAEDVYQRAREQCGSDPVLMFNLGVLLEDLGRPDSALDAYKASISEDPSFADCHYNLARLYQALTRPQDAIRHLGQYRRLTS
jgi:tetratricopeptide (TPR) repeat protein